MQLYNSRPVPVLRFGLSSMVRTNDEVTSSMLVIIVRGDANACAEDGF